MVSLLHPGFAEMNKRSLSGQAFFFITDFLLNEVQVFGIDELTQEEIFVHFPTFTNDDREPFGYTVPELRIFPESFEEYKVGFDHIMNNLKAGNSYLLNYTRKTRIEYDLPFDEIFRRAKAKYKVSYKNNWLFFSPETFIKIKDGQVYTEPMKGTIEAELPNAAELLRNDVKEKAEHYTVIDLLRNDLSRVADDVTVNDFGRIDYIETGRKNLFAMSSNISGQIKPEYRGRIGSILSEMLPAGSILGAPKHKTLEITFEAERYDRGFYTGVCGLFDGENLDSCVMIRFLEKENGQLFFKSGGGITHMSRAEAEYQECLNKIYVPLS